MNYEVAFTFITLVKVLFWVNFKDVITHLKSNWLDFGSNILTWLLNMTESFISFAIKLWESLSPLFSDLVENIWWNRQLRGSCIDDGWIACISTCCLHRFLAVSHSLAFQSPSS
jgi:hypothetical protein